MKTLKTKQAIFDYAVKQYLKQGKRSRVGTSCRYELVDEYGKTLHCLVGFLLKPDTHESCEGNTAFYIDPSVLNIDTDSAFSDDLDRRDFLCDLQKAHDRAADYYQSLWYLKYFAEDYHLTIPQELQHMLTDDVAKKYGYKPEAYGTFSKEGDSNNDTA